MIELHAEVLAGRTGQRLESGEADRATIYCRKSEIKLDLPHDQIYPFRMPNLGGAVSTALSRRQKRGEKSSSENLL